MDHTPRKIAPGKLPFEKSARMRTGKQRNDRKRRCRTPKSSSSKSASHRVKVCAEEHGVAKHLKTRRPAAMQET
eukprot:97414-Pleurochrysis_carterae.AAC.1